MVLIGTYNTGQQHFTTS